jgi:Amt family ammonium transporter
MTVNGALAGLVANTAPCAFVDVGASIVIGLVAGLIVVPAVLLFDRMKIDDTVGALSVHLVNGIWGTLSLGLFASSTAPGGGPDGLFHGGGFGPVVSQLAGIGAVGAFTLTVSFIGWFLIKTLFGMRVNHDEEMMGLDKSEMGQEAYPGDPTME